MAKCQSPAFGFSRASGAKSSVPTTSAQSSENKSVVEPASDETKTLIVVEEQDQAIVAHKYNVKTAFSSGALILSVTHLIQVIGELLKLLYLDLYTPNLTSLDLLFPIHLSSFGCSYSGSSSDISD